MQSNFYLIVPNKILSLQLKFIFKKFQTEFKLKVKKKTEIRKESQIRNKYK